MLGYQAYQVVSGSMEPALPLGSLIYVETVAPEQVETGDIIVFWSGDSPITHRVTKNRLVEGEFVTKGDANAQEDLEPVSYDSLIGRVAYHIPFLGNFLFLYGSTVGKVYIMAFALCGLLLHLLAGRIRARRREQALRQELGVRNMKLRQQSRLL
jgi:signal peptidase I